MASHLPVPSSAAAGPAAHPDAVLVALVEKRIAARALTPQSGRRCCSGGLRPDGPP
jgi:hypothetical protein